MELTEKSTAVLKAMQKMELHSAFHSTTFLNIINEVENNGELGITPRSHGIITSLVKKGLVQKGQDTGEGRKTYFLTEEGKNFEI